MKSIKFSQKHVKDWVLFVLVGVIVSVDAVVLLIGTALPESRLNATLIEDIEHPHQQNVGYIHTYTYSTYLHACIHFIYICIHAFIDTVFLEIFTVERNREN